MTESAAAPPRQRSVRLGWGLELLALTGFALTQPVLSVLGDAPDVFIFRDATTFDILAFAVIVTLLPPLVLWVIELLVSLVSTRVARIVHVSFIGVLVTLLAIQVLKKAIGIEGPVNLVLSVIVGVLVVLLYLRVDVVGLFLRFASVAPLAFALMFAFTSPVSSLVFPDDVQTVKVPPKKDAPSVVMVIFDEWPTSSIVDAQGNVDPNAFPNLAKLQQQATWYRNATSVSTATYYAVPTLLTGDLPESGDIPDAASHPQNLFTVFGQSYQMEAFESITRLCPRSLCPARSRGSSTGLSALLDDAKTAYRKMVSPSVQQSEITAAFEENIGAQTGGTQALIGVEHDVGEAVQARGDRFAQFLSTIKEGEAPTLHFLHILLPHVPYRFLPSGLEYPPPDFDFGRTGSGKDDWTDQTWPPALGHERLLLQAAYTDQLIGALMQRLKQTGLFKSSMVVLTADHGIAFTPGEPARGLTSTPVPASLYPQLLNVPLFIKAPGQVTGETTDTNVMATDVFPAMAKLAGLKLTEPVDGVPAGSRPPSDVTKLFEKASADGTGAKIEAPVKFDGTETLRAMLAGNVDATTAPGGDPALKLWRGNPYGTLVGQKVSDLTVGDPSPATGKTVFQGRLRNAGIWRSRGLPPSMVWGSADRPMTLALAMNGVIAGVSPTFNEPDLNEPNFWALMVPDTLMRKGKNEPVFYAVTGSAEQPVVRPVEMRRG